MGRLGSVRVSAAQVGGLGCLQAQLGSTRRSSGWLGWVLLAKVVRSCIRKTRFVKMHFSTQKSIKKQFPHFSPETLKFPPQTKTHPPIPNKIHIKFPPFCAQYCLGCLGCCFARNLRQVLLVVVVRAPSACAFPISFSSVQLRDSTSDTWAFQSQTYFS